MLNNHDQSVMGNYRTLACEIVLKAHNDLALALIDLKCLEDPSASPLASERCEYLLAQCRLRAKRINRYTLRHTPADRYDEVYGRLVKDEIEKKLNWRRSMVKVCRMFLLDNDSLVQMLDLDGGNIIRHAESVAEKWVQTGRLRLKKSVRAENFDKYTCRLEDR